MSIRGPVFPPGMGAWGGTARSASPPARCGSRKWNRRSSGRCGRWRASLAYDGERADAQVVDQLEAILRGVAEELAGWRARALKAETDIKELRGGAGGAGGGGGGAARLDPEVRNRLAELEQENKTLRQRVEAAKLRVHDLLGRLTFLEEQAREAGNGGGGGGGGGRAAGGSAGAATGGGAQ